MKLLIGILVYLVVGFVVSIPMISAIAMDHNDDVKNSKDDFLVTNLKLLTLLRCAFVIIWLTWPLYILIFDGIAIYFHIEYLQMIKGAKNISAHAQKKKEQNEK